MNEDKERQYWAEEHGKEGYNKVYSVTEDQGLRDRIVEELKDLPPGSKVLIPGCGSRAILETYLEEKLPNVDLILCTDFPEVVEVTSAKSEAGYRVRYEGVLSTEVGDTYAGQFDAVVVINCVVSEDDKANASMVKSFAKALKPGGKFFGLFPTIYCAVDVAHSDPSQKEFLSLVDLPNATFFEPVQEVKQIFYRPLGLRKIFNDAGLPDKKVEVYFLESEYFLKQSKEMYGINEDTPIYEHLVTARKPSPDNQTLPLYPPKF